MALPVNPVGNTAPPFFIFPRVKFQEHFLNGGPEGCVGSANPSGWMNADHFVQFLQHFQRYSGAKKEKPVLLILDNHESHLSIDGLQFCIDNGIVVLSLPPHCSHRLQPLDRTVFGSFKKAVNYFSDTWINAHPGRSMSIYDIPTIVSSAMDAAVTRHNIMSGFEATGIWPMNEFVFDDTDFMPSEVTDQPLAAPSDVDPGEGTSAMALANEPEEGAMREMEEAFGLRRGSSTPNESENEEMDDLEKTLESIRPYPKAPSRTSSSHRGRKRRSTAILTDPQTMKKLASQQKANKEKKNKKRRTLRRKKEAAQEKINKNNNCSFFIFNLF